jgi:PTS system beta-glucosides-specific IIC component
MKTSWKEMFGFVKSKDIIILSPIEGDTLPISEVSDPTFSEKISGDGIAIMPKKGEVVAPVDGTIVIMFETKHAISILSDQGTEILIHVGLDTVSLKGEFYKSYVKAKDKVKAGDLLLEFDMDKIKEAGFEIVTPIVICNTNAYTEIHTNTGKSVKKLDQIMTLKMKEK